MSNVITAVYKQGMLHPLQILPLLDYSRVKIKILETTPPANDEQEIRQIENVLVAAGLIKPLTPVVKLRRISTKRRKELASLYAIGGPLSELVITEREGR